MYVLDIRVGEMLQPGCCSLDVRVHGCVGRPEPAGANSKPLGLHPCHNPWSGSLDGTTAEWPSVATWRLPRLSTLRRSTQQVLEADAAGVKLSSATSATARATDKAREDDPNHYTLPRLLGSSHGTLSPFGFLEGSS